MNQLLAGKIFKGAYSAAIAFLGALGSSLSGDATFGSLKAQQWVWIALATLVAFGGTFGLSGWAGPASFNGGPKSGT